MYRGAGGYRLGHQVFQSKTDQPLVGILKKKGGLQPISMHYTYVLKSTKKSYRYIGSTENLKKRFLEHNQGKTQSICHLIHFELEYYEAYTTKKLARKREIELKKNSFKKRELFERISE